MTTRHAPRAGFTLLEVMAVMAIILIFAAVASPTVFSLTRDTKVKAGTDIVRARANDARAAAVGENRTYRLALSSDGTHIRVAPDDAAFDTLALSEDTDAEQTTVVVDEFPKGVTVRPIVDSETPTVTDASGWVRVATFRPDGTARDDAVIEIDEQGVAPVWVRVRALTGATSVGPRPKAVTK